MPYSFLSTLTGPNTKRPTFWSSRGTQQFPGTKMGRLLFFLLGIYAGVLANQRYQIPNTPTPSEVWEKASARFEKYKRDHPCHHKRSHSSFYEDPEVKDIIERLKALEKRQGRQTNEDSWVRDKQRPVASEDSWICEKTEWCEHLVRYVKPSVMQLFCYISHILWYL